MTQLEFSLAEAINVAVAGFIGAAVTIFVGWLSTRKLREHIYESLDRQAKITVAVGKGYKPDLILDDETGRVRGYSVADENVLDALQESHP